MPAENLGRLLIITGGKSVGKTTVASEILKLDPSFTRIITHTSRQPRINETQGVDYHFISEADFQKNIQDQFFFEWVSYAGYLKGTSRQSLSAVLEGQRLLWIIDPSRAVTIKDDISSDILKLTTVVLITASKSSQLRRFKEDQHRKLNNLEIEAFTKSLDEDKQFLSQKDKFDLIVENKWGKTTQTARQILAAFQKP